MADTKRRLDKASQPRGSIAAESSGEHYLPLAARDWVELLSSESASNDEERRCLKLLADMLDARFHFETHYQLRDLRHLYDQLDPDIVEELGEDEEYDEIFSLTQRFMGHFETILQRANYRRLSREEIEEAAEAASDWGVNPQIDLNAFDFLLVFARGAGTITRKRRQVLRPWRENDVEVPHYDRLVVAFSLKPGFRLNDAVHETAVYLKLFKEIPHADVDTLLPCSAFQMSWFDRTRIALPTLSGLGLAAFKMFKGGLIFAVNKIAGILALLGFIGGTIGYGVKSFLGYLRAKDKYQLTLTRSLYYQNLDNNAGVLFRLLDEAEQQDLLETLLAYWFLWRALPRSLSLDELDHQVEEFLAKSADAVIDFEVDDAVKKVVRLKLASQGNGGKWQAIPLPEALAELDRQWDALFDFRRNKTTAQLKTND